MTAAAWVSMPAPEFVVLGVERDMSVKSVCMCVCHIGGMKE